MNGYFKPHRRKTGVVTLAMACLFVGGWMRSLMIEDTMVFLGPALMSIDRHFGIGFVVDYDVVPIPLWYAADFQAWDDFILTASEKCAHLQCCGIHILASSKSPLSCFFFCSYWSIVIPLTLLSAWLLLSRSRVAKPPSPAVENAQ